MTVFSSASRSADAVVDIFPIETERLSASAFLKLMKENPQIIKSSTVIHPSAGKPGFGAFQVVYSRPLYRAIPGPKPRHGQK
ncbi:hypothetical protein [Rhizobacter fulvus]